MASFFHILFCGHSEHRKNNLDITRIILRDVNLEIAVNGVFPV